jgi:hypothetical protein
VARAKNSASDTTASSSNSTRRRRASRTAAAPLVEEPNDSATHQTAGDGVATLTTAQGIAISDDQNSLTGGDRGPTLLEDFAMREKIFHFAHQKFVAHNAAAAALFTSAGVDLEAPGYHRLDGSRKTADAFISTCRGVRAWDREI